MDEGYWWVRDEGELVVAHVDDAGGVTFTGNEQRYPPDHLEFVSRVVDPTGAVADVAAERRRHLRGEGWSDARDDRYVDGSLAAAAASFALRTVPGWTLQAILMRVWPSAWAPRWLEKVRPARRDLVVAGSLIIAEIDRRDRAARRGERPPVP